MTRYEARPLAGRRDVEALARVWKLLPLHTPLLGPGWVNTFSWSHTYVIVYENRMIIGGFAIHDSGHPYFMVDYLALHPDHRGFGAMKAAVRACDTYALQNGKCFYTFVTTSENSLRITDQLEHGTIKVWDRRGYQYMGRFPVVCRLLARNVNGVDDIEGNHATRICP